MFPECFYSGLRSGGQADSSMTSSHGVIHTWGEVTDESALVAFLTETVTYLSKACPAVALYSPHRRFRSQRLSL